MRRPSDTSFKPDRRAVRGRSPAFTLVELLVVVGVTGILLAIAVPQYARHRVSTQRELCIKNLMVIDQAKDQWLLDHPGEESDELYQEDLLTYFHNMAFPACPGGGVYDLGTIDQYPECSLEEIGHILDAGCGEEEPPAEPGGKPKRGKGHKRR